MKGFTGYLMESFDWCFQEFRRPGKGTDLAGGKEQ